MTMHGFVNRLTQLFNWLYYRHHWQGWEVLMVTSVVVLLLVVIWALRKQRDRREVRARVQMIQQNPSVIGIRLAARNQGPVDAADGKRRRLPFIVGRHGGPAGAAESAAASAQDAGQLQRQLDELKNINEELQSQNNQCKQTEDRLRRRLVKLIAAGKKLQQQRGKLEQAAETVRKQPKWSPLEILAPGRLYRNSRNAQGPSEETMTADPHRAADSRRSRGPLDVEKLKAIAALAKRIQSRPRRA